MTVNMEFLVDVLNESANCAEADAKSLAVASIEMELEI